jgi:hypothetical protein
VGLKKNFTGGAAMQLKSVFFKIYHEGRYYNIEFTLSDKCYLEISPYLSFRYGDRNYNEHGLVGIPFVYDVLIFKITHINEDYFLVAEEYFWSDFTEEPIVYEFKLKDVILKVTADFKDICWIKLMDEKELNGYLEYTERFGE